MIVLIILLIAVLGVVLFLRGEGDSYGKGNAGRTDKKRVNFSDKNFFL